MHTDFEIVKYSYLFNKEVLLSDKEPINFGCSAHASRCHTNFLKGKVPGYVYMAYELFRIYRLL